jgi:predicted dehydrogenase
MERAAWMRRDEFGRTVLAELAIHFIDLACVAVGPIRFPSEAVVASLAEDRALIRLTALGISAPGGVPVSLSVSVAGTAQRCHLTFEFERASYEVTFFPEGFRVLPIRSTPIDDLAAAMGRTVRYGLERSPIRRRNESVASPHSLIYQDHLTRTMTASETLPNSPFSLAGVADTMETLFGLEDVLSTQAIPTFGV